MNEIVAQNIKRLREERGLSLDALAKLSGVSKSMLAQIERGSGNPTLGTLWKIANGMMVPFDALIMQPKSPYTIVKTTDIQPLLEDDGRVRNYALFPDNEGRRFAVYYLELEPGASFSSDPHLHGTVEFITVFHGTLAIRADDHHFTVHGSESLRFPGDVPHSYSNVGSDTVTLHMILYNP